jgi:hypothetical protein
MNNLSQNPHISRSTYDGLSIDESLFLDYHKLAFSVLRCFLFLFLSAICFSTIKPNETHVHCF